MLHLSHKQLQGVVFPLQKRDSSNARGWSLAQKGTVIPAISARFKN